MSSSELGCVICSKPLVATQFDSLPPPDIDHVDFVRKLSDSVWPKILQYLLIPSQKFSEVLEVCRDEGFCPECFAIVRDIGKLQEKLLTLELMIQNKVETLGKALAAAAGPASTFRKSKKFQEVWKKFRLPVVNNFAKSRLPSPNVRLNESMVIRPCSNLRKDVGKDKTEILIKQTSALSKPAEAKVPSSENGRTANISVEEKSDDLNPSNSNSTPTVQQEGTESQTIDNLSVKERLGEAKPFKATKVPDTVVQGITRRQNQGTTPIPTEQRANSVKRPRSDLVSRRDGREIYIVVKEAKSLEARNVSSSTSQPSNERVNEILKAYLEEINQPKIEEKTVTVSRALCDSALTGGSGDNSQNQFSITSLCSDIPTLTGSQTTTGINSAVQPDCDRGKIYIVIKESIPVEKSEASVISGVAGTNTSNTCGTPQSTEERVNEILRAYLEESTQQTNEATTVLVSTNRKGNGAPQSNTNRPTINNTPFSNQTDIQRINTRHGLSQVSVNSNSRNKGTSARCSQTQGSILSVHSSLQSKVLSPSCSSGRQLQPQQRPCHAQHKGSHVEVISLSKPGASEHRPRSQNQFPVGSSHRSNQSNLPRKLQQKKCAVPAPLWQPGQLEQPSIEVINVLERGFEPCTKCEYKVYFEFIMKPWFTETHKKQLRYQERAKARKLINEHYLNSHLQVGPNDLTPCRMEEGTRCYSCSLCPYQTFPMDEIAQRKKAKWESALNSLVRHYKLFHDSPASKTNIRNNFPNPFQPPPFSASTTSNFRHTPSEPDSLSILPNVDSSLEEDTLDAGNWEPEIDFQMNVDEQMDLCAQDPLSL